MMYTPRPDADADQEHRSSFREQTGAADLATLHCRIPATLHRRLKYLAVDHDTSIAAIVTSLLEQHLGDYQS